MAGRASQKGEFILGLVQFPMRLYPVARSHDRGFKQLHRTCMTPLNSIRYCAQHEEYHVEMTDVVRGVEVVKPAKGRAGVYVPFSDEDFASLPLESVKGIHVEFFLPAQDVPSLRIEKSSFMEADDGGDRTYKAMRDAMKEMGLVAIGKMATSSKEHLVAVEPDGDRLMVRVLFYADEMNEPSALPNERAQAKPQEMAMLKQLIAAMQQDASALDETRDTLQDAIQERVKAKQEGREVAVLTPHAEPAGDLFDTLRAALAQMGQKPVEVE